MLNPSFSNPLNNETFLSSEMVEEPDPIPERRNPCSVDDQPKTFRSLVSKGSALSWFFNKTIPSSAIFDRVRQI